MKASGGFKHTQATKDKAHLSHHLKARCPVQPARQKSELQRSLQGKIPSVLGQAGTSDGCTALRMHRVLPLAVPGARVTGLGQTVASDGYTGLGILPCVPFSDTTLITKHTWVFLKHILLGNGFSLLEVQFLWFSHDTCRNTSLPSKADEVPRSHWLLVKHSLEYLNPFGRVFISHLDVFRMIPLHLLRLHYPWAGQRAKGRDISTLCSPPTLPEDTSGHHRPALLCKSCVHGSRICQVGQKQSTVCCKLPRKSLFTVIHKSKEIIKWEDGVIFNTRDNNYFLLTLPSTYSG